MILVSILMSLMVHPAGAESRVDDGTLFKLTDQIQGELMQNEHSQSALKQAEKHLKVALQSLQAQQEESAVASLNLSGVPYVEFGSVSAGESTTQTLVLTNVGTGTATAIFESGLYYPIHFLGGSFPGASGNCSTTLASGASCTIVIEFAPNALGTFLKTLTLTYFDGVAYQSVSRDFHGVGN